MNAMRGLAAQPWIGFGHVVHGRLRPRRHHFRYPTFFLMLPMRTLQRDPAAAGVLALNRAGAMSFHDVDHGDGRVPESGGALAWLDELLQGEGIDDADGEVWLHCYPRVLGYTFKPVSFWYCHASDGSLRAIVAEVNNTFGERHAYVLSPAIWDVELKAPKRFHVSPFCSQAGEYRFRFRCSKTADAVSTAVRVNLHQNGEPLMVTAVSGRLQPLDMASRRQALWRYPFMTLGVTARILWQASRLWLKRLPVFHKPPAPSVAHTRSTHIS